MSGMRELKLRIKSIKETQQITKAMKLISAAKLKKARQLLEQTTPYFLKVESTIAEILAHKDDVTEEHIYFDNSNQKHKERTAFLVLTGDKGMAGSYNHNIIKLAEDIAKKHEDSIFFVAGNIGRNYFSKKDYNIVKDFDYPVQDPTVSRAKEVTNILINMYKKGEVGAVYILFTNMVSSVKLEPMALRLLPLNYEVLKEELKFDDIKVDNSLNYEPSPKAVFEVLVPKYIKGVVYGAFVEAFTSEQNARMMAMENSTKNADEMLAKLQLSYNRARQWAITQEISEVVGGASAL